MLLGNLDAAGRLLTSVVAPSATDSFNGGIASAPNGALRVITGTPPQFANSFGVSATGQLYIQAGGTIDHFTGGLPFTANGSLVVQENATPDSKDPYVGGIRVEPVGGVYTVTDTPPVNSIPVNTELPSIKGSGIVGTALTADPGAWSGYPAPTFAYQWKRGATDVGTNSNSYTLVTADFGQSMTCVVTATNSSGSTPATSNAISGIASLPVNTILPAITGTGKVGSVLTSDTGTWTGTPSPTYAYQWKRGGGNVGTNTNTYTVVSGDVGSLMTCVVTATNASGSTNATSNAITGIALLIPVFTNVTVDWVEGDLKGVVVGSGYAYPANNDDGSFTYVFNNTNTVNSADGYFTLVGNHLYATAAGVAGAPNSFATLPNQFSYTIRATSVDGTGTGIITGNCLQQVAGENPIITTAKAILATYGANAHVFVAGIDSSSGYPADNYVDNGVTPAVVGNAIFLAKDATADIDANQSTLGNRPVLRNGGVVNAKQLYYWEFVAANNKSFTVGVLGTSLWQLGDDHCIISGVTGSSSSTAVWFSTSAISGLSRFPALSTNSTISSPIWRDDAGTASGNSPGASITSGVPFVMSNRKSGNTLSSRLGGVQFSTGNTSTLGATTLTQSKIGGLQASNLPFDGKIYAIILIKSAVSDANVRSLEEYVALLSGVTLL